MDLWKSLGGMVTAELICADPASALGQVNAAGITVFDAAQSADEITVRFSVRRRDIDALKILAQRKGYSLKTVRYVGLYWQGKKLLKRPVLLFGILLLTLLAMYLPTRVYFFRVEGNVQIPTRLILEKCEQCGIGFGASRREVRSEKMKNALLEAIPQLQWAGINTSGCVATITVRERTDTQTAESVCTVSSIVAARDGIITQCTVTKGNPLCKVGQAVQAGQVLVSGYTDCGISIRATRAEAEIFAQTSRNLTAVTPLQWCKEGSQTRVEKKYALVIGKNRINFYFGSGISDSSCDKMYEENYLTLPGGFQLPVCLVTETWTYYEPESVKLTQEDASQTLSAFARQYTLEQMIAGQILRQEETVIFGEDACTLQADYDCHEMIGLVKKEEIPYGKYD